MRAVEDNDRIEDEIDRRIELIWNTEDIIGQALVLLTNEGVCDHLLDDVVRQLAENRVERDLESASVRRQAQLMRGLMFVGGVGTLALALGPGVVVAVFGWLVRDVAAEVIDPLGVTIMNNHPDSSVRATVVSFWGQAEAGGEIMGGIVLGTLAELTTVPITLAAAAGLYVPKRPRDLPSDAQISPG